MSSKDKEKIVGLHDASFDERCATGPNSWWMIYPSTRKNTEENIRNGGKEFIAYDPPRPFKWMFSSSGEKYKFTAADLKVLLNLVNKFKSEIDNDFELAGIRAEEQAEEVKKIFQQ